MKNLSRWILGLAGPFLIFLFFVNCSGPRTVEKSDAENAKTGTPPVSTSGLKYFGYVGIDCGLDDPHDSTNKINYADEVGPFSNLAHVCANDHTEDIRARLQVIKDNGLKAVLDFHNLFFVLNSGGTPGGSGVNYDLAPDYVSRWNSFVAKNATHLNSEYILATYIADEPYWLGITFQEIQSVASLLKATMPQVPTGFVEAYSALDQLQVPTNVDWIGMDRYGSADAANDPLWQADHLKMRGKRSRSDQKLIVVADAQWLPMYGDAGYPESAMGGVAAGYFNAAENDPDVIAVIGYTWAGGIDGPTHKGTRDLPQSVIDIHKAFGRKITGK